MGLGRSAQRLKRIKELEAALAALQEQLLDRESGWAIAQIEDAERDA